MFEKTIAVRKEIKRRKNITKERIKKQINDLKDTVPFNAKLGAQLKVINMLFEKCDLLKECKLEVDEKSESLFDQQIENLSDYIIHKDENNPLNYNIYLKQIEI